MKRKKGILLAAVVETFVLAILLLLFFTGRWLMAVGRWVACQGS